jgi:hypothetical protein
MRIRSIKFKQRSVPSPRHRAIMLDWLCVRYGWDAFVFEPGFVEATFE